jgi:hypothetical protein
MLCEPYRNIPTPVSPVAGSVERGNAEGRLRESPKNERSSVTRARGPRKEVT